VDRLAAGAEVLRDSSLAARFGARLVAALRLERTPLREATEAFAFKRMDLRLIDGAFAVFLAALDLDFAFDAISRAEL